MSEHTFEAQDAEYRAGAGWDDLNREVARLRAELGSIYREFEAAGEVHHDTLEMLIGYREDGANNA